MSQRKLSFFEKHEGLEAIKILAQRRGLHLLLLTDDKGQELVAASIHPNYLLKIASLPQTFPLLTAPFSDTIEPPKSTRY